MKLEKYALIAEVVSAIAVVTTLIFVIAEIRANTDATLAANRQSLAGRTEQFLAATATNPELAALVVKVRSDEELTDVERFQYGSLLAQALRLAEEGYLQYLDGNLASDYWQTRARNTVDSRMDGRLSRELYYEWSERGWFTPQFTEWLDGELELKYGSHRPGAKNP